MRFSLLLLFAYCNLSLALGIGDVALKSHLGESLVAKINVTDVEKSPDTSCFSVTDSGDAPAFKKAFVSLSPTNNGFQLIINTRDIITEPIINLHVTYHCDPYFSRDYVLLIDPAPQSDEETSPDSSIPADNSAINKIKPTSPTSNQAKAGQDAGLSNDAAKENASRKKKIRGKAVTSSSIDEKLIEAYTGKRQATIKPATKPLAENKNLVNKTVIEASNDRPYLTISGGDLKSNEKASLPKLALRLETQIDFSRVESTPLNTTDVMDEVTVMANRLAHLEKQIVSLQSKNTQLQSDAEQAKKQLLEQKPLWRQYLRIAISLVAFLAFAEWLRRKLARDRLNKEQDRWFETGDVAVIPDDSTIISTNNPDKNVTAAKNSIFDDSFFDDSIYSHSAGLDSLIANTSSMTDENSDNHEDILESADVFIEHGRPGLAIQLLQNHLGDYPSDSPKVWLKLLSLLASDGSEAEYEQAMNECSQHYNIKMPSFAEAKKPDSSSIEDFSNIVTRLEGAWGSPIAVGFLNDLIYNQQSQPIEGFGRETFEDLFLLKQIAERLSASSSKERDEFYQPEVIKPSLDNLAFNEATFGDNDPTDDTKVSNDANQISKDLEAEKINLEVRKIKKDSQITANKFKASIENSPFQTLPSYEVGMLSGFDDTPDVGDAKKNASTLQNKSSTQDESEMQSNIEPQSNTSIISEKDNALLEIEPSPQAAEIDFSQHMQEIERMQGLEIESSQDTTTPATANKNQEQKNEKESNLIEWDLPNIK